MGIQTTTNQPFHLNPTHTLPKMESHGKFERSTFLKKLHLTNAHILF